MHINVQVIIGCVHVATLSHEPAQPVRLFPCRTAGYTGWQLEQITDDLTPTQSCVGGQTATITQISVVALELTFYGIGRRFDEGEARGDQRWL